MDVDEALRETKRRGLEHRAAVAVVARNNVAIEHLGARAEKDRTSTMLRSSVGSSLVDCHGRTRGRWIPLPLAQYSRFNELRARPSQIVSPMGYGRPLFIARIQTKQAGISFLARTMMDMDPLCSPASGAPCNASSCDCEKEEVIAGGNLSKVFRFFFFFSFFGTSAGSGEWFVMISFQEFGCKTVVFPAETESCAWYILVFQNGSSSLLSRSSPSFVLVTSRIG